MICPRSNKQVWEKDLSQGVMGGVEDNGVTRRFEEPWIARLRSMGFIIINCLCSLLAFIKLRKKFQSRVIDKHQVAHLSFVTE